jgi:hypothetical protein
LRDDVGAGVADGEPEADSEGAADGAPGPDPDGESDAAGPLDAPEALGSLEAPAAEAVVDAVAKAAPAPGDPDAGWALGPADATARARRRVESGPFSNGDMPANAAASNRTTNARPRTASVRAAETIGGRPRRS